MEKMVKPRKKDKRIERTKNAIQNAFIILLAEKGYKDITVKDIADRAEVDRRTIYNYYKGIHEVREELDKTIAMMINETFVKLDIKNHLHDPEWIAVALGENIEKNFDMLDKLFKISMDSELLLKVEGTFANMLADLFESSGLISNEKKHIAGNFAAAGLLYSFQNWFKSNRLVSIRVETRYIVIMIASVVKSVREYSL